jgi:chitodextrinase
MFGFHLSYATTYDGAANGNNSVNSALLTTTMAESDTIPPTVSISAPLAGAKVSGTTVSVSANAGDNVGVVGVRFKLDGTNLGAEDLTSPYTVIWNASIAKNGPHTLTATARDAAGNTTTSAGISVTVILPDVIVTSLNYGNGIFTSTVKNQGATATPAGISIGVGYLIDGVSKTWGQVNGPLAAGASLTIGTDGGMYTIPAGAHSITAYVDDVNRFAESDETNNTLTQTLIIEKDSIAPTVPTNLSATAIYSGAINLTWTASTDGIGVTGYNVFRNGVKVGTVAQASFLDKGLTALSTYSYTVAAFDGSKNNSAQSSVKNVTVSVGGTTTANHFFGVGGHPWGVYSGFSATALLDLVQMMGAGIYRVDLGTTRYTLADQLLAAAKTRDIQLYATLYGTNGNYTASYNEGYAFATRYAGKIPYYQVSNERDVSSMTTESDGTLPSDFNDIKYAQAKAEIQGLLDGVRAGDPNAKTIVNFSWLHYGFIQRLINDGINFDILGIDWYSNMGDITNVKNKNLTYYLKRQFGKPVWVTEGDRWEGSTGGNEAAQATYISQTATAIYNNPDINAYIVYELLDEPGVSPDFERHMGLLYDVNSPKPAYEAYKQVIANSVGKVIDPETPAVSITEPAGNATVSGTSVTVSATASDNVGVVGVQFKLDGKNLGAEDTVSPYSVSWNTTTVTKGPHTLTAVARDAVWNKTTSNEVSVSVTFPVGTIRLTDLLKVMTYPNPATTSITIELPVIPKNEKAQIYDTMGRIVKEINISALSQQVNIEDLSNGVYFIRITDSPNFTLKFIKH